MTWGQHPSGGWAVPGSPGDRALWRRMSAVLTHAPRLTTSLPVPSNEAERVQAQADCLRLVRQIDQLADEVSAAIPHRPLPAYPGTTQAVADSVVRLCQAFVWLWSTPPPMTATNVEAFNQELAGLLTLLDSVAPAPPPQAEPGQPGRATSAG